MDLSKISQVNPSE
uniref:Uncharacterized protein n=1 Tax=Moniliophthora roreri TaxID=221103 RepID=A0A0W0GF27_MONRR